MNEIAEQPGFVSCLRAHSQHEEGSDRHSFFVTVSRMVGGEPVAGEEMEVDEGAWFRAVIGGSWPPPEVKPVRRER